MQGLLHFTHEARFNQKLFAVPAVTERPRLDVRLNDGVKNSSPNEAFGIEDGVIRIRTK